MKTITREKLYDRGHGLSPGQLIKVSSGRDGACQIRVIAYGPDALEIEDVNEPEEAFARVGKAPVTWIHIQGIQDTQRITQLCSLLGMHTLAIEDVLSNDARPKFEEFGPCLFIVAKAAMLSAEREAISFEQVSFFVGPNFLLSIQESDARIFAPIEPRLEQASSRMRSRSVSYLLFALLDLKNDCIMAILDALEADIIEIEEGMLEESGAVTIEDLYRKKRSLLMMMRVVLPMRDNATRLELLDHPLIAEVDRYFFRDLADYARRAAERVEHSRLLMQNMQEFYHAGQEHKINQVMKVLTVIATLFLPLTFIAGVYGMNFDHEVSPWNMPELYAYYGYPLCLLFMAGVFFSFLWWFRKQRWI